MRDWGNVISARIGRKVRNANDVDRGAMGTPPLHTDAFRASVTVTDTKILASVMSATENATARTTPRESTVTCVLPGITEILEPAESATINVSPEEY